MRVKYMKKELKEKYNLEQYPNFHFTGSINGMKELYYGQNCFLVRSGQWIYNVPKEIYDSVE